MRSVRQLEDRAFIFPDPSRFIPFKAMQICTSFVIGYVALLRAIIVGATDNPQITTLAMQHER